MAGTRSKIFTLLLAVLQLGFLDALANAEAISSAPNLEAQAWGQCGGAGYSGFRQCPEGYTCDKVNKGKPSNSVLYTRPDVGNKN